MNDGPIGQMPVVLRLKRRADFLRATRARNSAAAPGLVLQARPLDETEQKQLIRDVGGQQPSIGPPEIIRIGFTASRKVGNAVKRNRAKRRLRALADEVLRAHARPGMDYVLIARAATPDRAFDKLRGDMHSALKRVKCRRDEGTEGARKSPA